MLKRVLFWSILVLTALFLVEAGARLILALGVGPSVLRYGTPWDRQRLAAAPAP